jgi:hypothetical protein
MEKSYYAIIPASVRYDKRLCPNAKLLYGEITALCNEKGYCWATNAYFSGLYEVSNRSIVNWINELEQAGHISINYEKYNISGGGISENNYTRRFIMLTGDMPFGRVSVKKSSKGGEINY